MKRNLAHEIKGIKQRGGYGPQYLFVDELEDIESTIIKNFGKDIQLDRQLLKYIPIITIACLEAFMRSVIKEIVDFGKPYSQNAIKFNQTGNVKFDFEIINEIQSKSVTMGELLSHILPCNNFNDINFNLSTLLACDFTESLKKHKRNSNFEHLNNNFENFTNHHVQIISDVKRMFELRHIFCHEFETTEQILKEEIFGCLANTRIFLEQVNDFVWWILYPNTPETQIEMNIAASEDFKKVETELDSFLQEIKVAINDEEISNYNEELFDKTIELWKNYREAKAKLNSYGLEGGTIYPLYFSSSLTQTTKEKLESLKNQYPFAVKK